MADNVFIKDAGDLTVEIAADEVAGLKIPRVKLQVGPDGASVDFKHKAGPQAETFTAAHGAGLGGTVLDVSAQGMSQAGMEVKATGTPTSWEVHLQASFDNVGWDTQEIHKSGVNSLGTKIYTAPGVFGFYYRVRVVSLVLGSATDLRTVLALKD